MRSLRLVALAALALTGCAREITVNGPPVVLASGDMELPLQDSIMLGASAHGSSAISHYDWSLVSSPAMDRVSIVAVTDLGDIAMLKTQSLAGLYVVSVIATDKDGRVSDPDFVNIRLLPGAEALQVSLSCQAGCGTDPKSGNKIVDELTSPVFAATVTAGNADDIRWSATLKRDPKDSLTDQVQITQDIAAGTATLALPRVTADASLAVIATAYAAGQPDAIAELDLTLKNSTDEPPTISLSWRVPGPTPQPDHVLPGDAIYLQATVGDPNGDQASCSFATASDQSVTVKTTSDPCRIVVFPLASGPLHLSASALTASPQAKTDASVDITVAAFQLEQAGAALTAVALSQDGDAVATTATADYYVYDASAASLAGTKMTGALSGGTAAAFSGTSQALLGFKGATSVEEYDFSQAKALANMPITGTVKPLPTSTRAMASGTNGKVWLALDNGLALFDPWVNMPLSWVGSTKGLAASAIAWGPSPIASASEGYVWYAENSDVYCQTGEDSAQWQAGKGNKVGTVQNFVNLTALSPGTPKTWDLWVAAAPSGAANFGALLLYWNAVDPTTGSLQMNDALPLFTQLSGGVLSVAVERDGAYESDAWAIAGGNVVRVSRAPVDDADGKTLGAVDLVLSTAFDGKAKAVSVVGRRVVVATDQGLAVVQ